MKKISQVLFSLVFICFSFYYADKAVDIIRDNDPLMKTIKEQSGKYEIDPVNATLEDNNLIPGATGLKVDTKASFKKMKKYGSFNESLLVFEEVGPAISMDDYYDKYIPSGRETTSDVALIFRVSRDDNIDAIMATLVDSGIEATFFVDGLWMENNQELVLNMAELGYEVEVLNYNERYEKIYFESSLSMLQKITNLKGKYCYAEYDQKEVLELCGNLKLHTVIPTIKTGSFPYQEVKSKLTGGSMISFRMTNETQTELLTVINYIKQKGYTLTTLDKLLNEVSSDEK